MKNNGFHEGEFLEEINRAKKETVEVIKEDICGWLNQLMPSLNITRANFMDSLCDGVTLLTLRQILEKKNESIKMFQAPQKGSFQARDNIAQFVHWMKDIHVNEYFETSDLADYKSEKAVVFGLLDVARKCAAQGLLVDPLPLLVQYEREMKLSDSNTMIASGGENEMTGASIISAAKQNQITEGSYIIGNKKVHIRKVHQHLMVRTGGGWQVIEDFIRSNFGVDCPVKIYPIHAQTQREARHHHHSKTASVIGNLDIASLGKIVENQNMLSVSSTQKSQFEPLSPRKTKSQFDLISPRKNKSSTEATTTTTT
eukprot:c13091_g1_i1.p1 GENE.c13091_g1_i1~~c13091_g1_i1.p1  ORF type:complete len:313 (+),score=178.28 c13091_g1_i1:30-968(+)